MTNSRRTRLRAFTLVETMMACVAVGAVTIAVYATLVMGTILFEKNAALNVSHEQARTALLQMEQDIHGAVSLPMLTGTNFVTISGTGPAAGVTFQSVASGTMQLQVATNAAYNSSHISVYFPSSCPTPYAGERLIMPTYQIEQDITAVTTSGSTAALTLSGSLSLPVTTSSNGHAYDIPCFLTQRVYYVVVPAGTAVDSNSTTSIYALNYYGINRTDSYILASNGFNTSTPFSIPTSSSGSENTRDIVALNLSILNTTFNDAVTEFNCANILLNGQVPIYSKITVTQ